MPPPPAAVEVWRHVLTGAEDLDALAARLSPDEAARAGRFLAEADRRRNIVARALLRRLLGRHTGTAPQNVVIETAAQGKPFLRSGPHFSVSHSGDLIAIAVSPDHPVGIDVERIDPRRDIAALAARIMSAGELAYFRALPEPARLAAFYTAWTRKEAVAKALGDGLSRSFPGIETALDNTPPLLRHLTPAPAGIPAWTLTDLALHPGYAAALACTGYARPGAAKQLIV